MVRRLRRFTQISLAPDGMRTVGTALRDVRSRISWPTAQPQRSLVCCNTIPFALQEWRWSLVGLPISASASWSAGSPLPLSQAGESHAYGSFPLPSELSATLRQRMLRLELTPEVARHTAKAVEDYPHSKTLTRLPSPSLFFALCHHLAIRTGHCYSLPGRRPTAIKLSLEALETRIRSQSPIWNALVFESPIREPFFADTRSSRMFSSSFEKARAETPNACPAINTARIRDSQTIAFPGWSLGTSTLFSIRSDENYHI